MKLVIFICLLSISMCLSDTATKVGNSSAPIPPEVHDKIETKTNTTQPAATNPPIEKDNKTIPTNSTIPKNETTVKPTNETKPVPIIPQVPDKTVPSANSSSNASTPPSTTVNPPTTNGTVPADNKTVTPEPHKVVPTPAEPAIPAVQARGFDGASFVGGIILTLGLLAIGFMGFKYYKNQTERNYHTL